MRPGADVILLRSGNRLTVDSTEPLIHDALAPLLSFTAKRFLYGYERKRAGRAVDLEEYNLYFADHRGRIATSFGFYERISRRLRQLGCRPLIRDLTPHPDPSVFTPQWDRVVGPASRITLRPGQDEFLVKLMGRLPRPGFPGLPARFDVATGVGKSFLIGLVALMLPRAKIHIATKRVAVLADRIYPELCQMLPGVGLCCGRKHIMGKRVMCFSFDSLQHSDGQADVLMIDESHESATNSASTALGRYGRSLNFGFSATHDMRIDNKDLRVEAICGPIVHRVSYQEAQAAGLVVPIQIHWNDVHMDADPAAGIEDPTEWKRWSYWRNSVRNQKIADSVRRYDAKTQVLITTETIEHALGLKCLLPEYEVVYREEAISAADEAYFRRIGVWPEGHRVLSVDRKAALTRAFEQGRLAKAIVTTVWNVGVSFNHLAVLARADGNSTPTGDTQIPGRTCRVAEGKDYAIVEDYLDQFNSKARRRAQARERDYTSHGWQQVMPEKAQHALFLED